MFVQYNPNPKYKRVGDCVIRAVSKATGQDWETTFTGIALKAYEMCDMPSANYVWGAYLQEKGFHREFAPDNGEVYTVADFAAEHPKGTYVLAISGHVVCVKNGDWYDTWNSQDEVPIYVWSKGE